MDGLTSSTVGFSGIVIERYDFHTPDFSFLIGLVHDFLDASGNVERLGCFGGKTLQAKLNIPSSGLNSTTWWHGSGFHLR